MAPSSSSDGSSQTIQTFKDDNIPVFQRGEEEYERSVATANLLYRFTRPIFVVQPKTARMVRAIIEEVRAKNLKVTIKCGGHSYAGHSTAPNGGVSLDLRQMKHTKLELDSDGKPTTITFGAGCQWGHVYKTLINGGHDGYMVNGGRCPTVGVSGFLLGAGLGPFSRSIGMGSDTIEEIKIVTADSNLVTVKKTDSDGSKEGSLFWALCGAGGGNFGVVVEMKLAVMKLRAPGGKVVAGRYQWFAGKDEPDLFGQKSFMSTMKRFYTTDWPKYMTIDSTWICDLRQNTGNGVRFLTYFDGDKKEFDDIIDDKIIGDKSTDDKSIDDETIGDKFKSIDDETIGDKSTEDESTDDKNMRERLAEQLKRRSLAEKSTQFLHETLVAQWSEETVRAFPSNKSYSIYSSFVFGNDLGTIEQVTALIRGMAVDFRKNFLGEKVEFLATFIHSGEQTSAPNPTDSAFFWREAVYHMYLTLEWEDKWMELDMKKFLDDAKALLRPLSLQKEAAYINFPDGALQDDKTERAYWGDNCERLRRVKKVWDKHDFFHAKQGVRLPSGIAKKGRGGRKGLTQWGDLRVFQSTQPARQLSTMALLQSTQPARQLSTVTMAQPLSDSDSESESEGPDSQRVSENSDDQGNDEDLTDPLASKQWESYDTRDTVGVWKFADMSF